MKSHPSFQNTCLAALLLAGCCAAIAESDTASPVAQNPVATQAVAPAADATTDPVVANDPAYAPAPPDKTHEPAEMNPAAGDVAADADTAGDAGTADVPEAAAVAAIDPGTLYGEWIAKEQHPDAGEVVTLFSINADSSFAGTMTVADNVVWRYSGNWYLDGNLITWFYTQSMPALNLADETEVDEIITVDSEKLIYRSGKRDALETIYRSR
jgi:hypothetical protein